MAGRGPRPTSPPPSSYRLLDDGAYFKTRVLDQLLEYEGYAAAADGVEESLSQPYLQPIWDRAVDLLPTWYRPAVATLAALGLIIITTLILLAHTPPHSPPEIAPPVWPNVAAGAAVLVYQVVGATENTRVRRATAKATKTQRGKEGVFWLFWHGCNSVAVGFLVLGAMLELQMERPSTVLIGVLMGYTAAYFAHWQKYVSGHRRVTSHFVDVAETQLILASVHLLTVVCGRAVWTMKVASYWQVNHIVLALLFWRASLVVLNYWLIILEGGPGEDGTTTAGTAVLSPVIPGLLVLVISAMLVRSSASAFDKVPFLSIIGVICMYAKVLNKLIVAQATKTPVEQVDVMIWPGVLLWIGAYIGFELESVLGFGPNTLSIAGYSLAMAVNLVIYWTQLTMEITRHVGIDLFAQTHRVVKGKRSTSR
eukprot:m.117012 g.117012  ORF g.117012 m.117012 type:complete len:424 (+) comp10938_c0_seq1:90-1361(+)